MQESVTPLLTHWSYIFLALTHQIYTGFVCWKQVTKETNRFQHGFMNTTSWIYPTGQPTPAYLVLWFQALQAPACHENMVKVGGYILGEFGNLIAGDPRSRWVNTLTMRQNGWHSNEFYWMKISTKLLFKGLTMEFWFSNIQSYFLLTKEKVFAMSVTNLHHIFSSPMVQFDLLHSKFHLCSVATRGLLLSTYIKFVNLFPEIKGHIQGVSETA